MIENKFINKKFLFILLGKNYACSSKAKEIEIKRSDGKLCSSNELEISDSKPHPLQK